jgi:predicted deacylase
MHVVTGLRPGPTLALVGGLHGDEHASVDLLRRIVRSVDPTKLSGTLVVIPMANPLAFESGTRNTPQDALDLNRQFPGSKSGWVSEQIAAADCIVDYHSGMDNLQIHYTYMGSHSDASVAAQLKALSIAHGLEYIFGGGFNAGSLSAYASSVGIPAFSAMVGGGLGTDPRLEVQGIHGARNVMRHLGMLAGHPELPERQWLIRDRQLLRFKTGGMFVPNVGPGALCSRVARGYVLGAVVDPRTFEELEAVVAPFEDNALLLLRSCLAKVHPGDYAFITADMATAEPITR